VSRLNTTEGQNPDLQYDQVGGPTGIEADVRSGKPSRNRSRVQVQNRGEETFDES